MDRRNDVTSPAPAQPPTLATPLVWAGGSLLLTCTTFLVSIVALFRAFGSLFH